MCGGPDLGDVANIAARTSADAVSFGLNEVAGNPAGKLASKVGKGIQNLFNPSVGGPGSSPGQITPMQILMQTGGAPLLASISMGAKVTDAIAGYFGKSGANFDSWINSLDDADKQAIEGLKGQLSDIQSNTDSKNQAISKLVNDFPNFMQTMIPKYASIMDDATKQMMDQAMKGAAAKYAVGGMVSSGAMNEAAAKIGAQGAMDKINYGTSLALNDWQSQYNEASALRNFQQKMLGNQIDTGKSAYQLMLESQGRLNEQSASFDQSNKAARANQENALFGTLGKVGGGLLGGAFGGPAGAAAGEAVGGAIGSSSTPAYGGSGYR